MIKVVRLKVDHYDDSTLFDCCHRLSEPVIQHYRNWKNREKADSRSPICNRRAHYKVADKYYCRMHASYLVLDIVTEKGEI